MSLTGDTFDFQQGNVVTSSAQMVDNAATVGDVLTVQADKSIAAAAGGGSLPSEWTVSAGGSLTIQSTDATELLDLEPPGDSTSGFHVQVSDQGGGDIAADLRVRSKGTEHASITVDGQTVNGESAQLDSRGQLELFTLAGRNAIEAWDGPGNTLRFALIPAGQPMIGVVAAPADGDLSASQVALWFDDTNGAAKLKIKGKSADGTVVTGTVNLT